MKKRLLVLSSTYPRWSGDAQPDFVHELSRRFYERFDVYVLCPHAPGAKFKEYFDQVKVFRFHYAPDRFESLVQDGGILANIRHASWKLLLVPFFLLSMAWKAHRLIRQLNPDAIHAHWIVPQDLVLLVLRLFQAKMPPIVITSHGSDLIALQGKLMFTLKRRILKQSDCVTVVSQPMRELAKQLGVCDERVHVMSLLHQVKKLGLRDKVRFVGAIRQSELPGFYRRVTLIAIPFIGQEGLGLVTLEAIACECPVVVSQIVSVSDLMSEELDSECLVPPADSVELAAKISIILSDPKKYRMKATERRNRVSKRYDWKIASKRYADLLENVMLANESSRNAH